MLDTGKLGTALALAIIAVGAIAPAHAQYRGGDVVIDGSKLVFEPPPPGPIQEPDVLCERAAGYNIVWGDGREGVLVLARPVAPDFAATGFLATSTSVFALRHEVVVNPQDVVDGEPGPGYRGVDSTLGHRIVFWVDFNHTPADLGDDARFDGYMMTVTRDSMAGVTWSEGVPYGFYATDKTCTDVGTEPIR